MSGDEDEETLILGCGSLTIGVTGTPDILDHVRVYFPGPGRPVDVVAAVVARVVPAGALGRLAACLPPAAGEAWGHPELPYRVHPREEGTVLVPMAGPPHLITVAPGAARTEVVAAEPRVLAVTVTRVVRQLAIRHTEQAGGLLGHAAAIVTGGRVVVLAGRPGAGKTTIALLLARAGAALCAGDRLLLLPRPGGGWDAAELPLAWRIAPGTMTALGLDGMASALPARARGQGLADGKHEFSAGELCRLLGVPRVSVGPVASIVVLSRDPSGPPVVRPALRPAASLSGTLLRPEDALFTSDWLGLGTIPSPAETAARGEALAAGIPVLEASWPGHDAMPALAAMIGGGSWRG